jgi:hypothetical protein
MIAAFVVFAYLATVLAIGLVARKAGQHAAPAGDAEDFFLAGRSLGPAVFLLSLFGANMTAFSILGASGHAFANGIVTYGLMASSSALIIPSVCSRSAPGCGRWASETGSSRRYRCSAIAGSVATSARRSSSSRPPCSCPTSSSP